MSEFYLPTEQRLVDGIARLFRGPSRQPEFKDGLYVYEIISCEGTSRQTKAHFGVARDLLSLRQIGGITVDTLAEADMRFLQMELGELPWRYEARASVRNGAIEYRFGRVGKRQWSGGFARGGVLTTLEYCLGRLEEDVEKALWNIENDACVARLKAEYPDLPDAINRRS